MLGHFKDYLLSMNQLVQHTSIQGMFRLFQKLSLSMNQLTRHTSAYSTFRSI